MIDKIKADLICKTYYESVHKFCVHQLKLNHFDADDVTQEVFVLFQQKADTLEDKNIYVSAGSACSSNKPAISATLKSIGLSNNLLDSTVRFSFCVDTTMQEVDYAIEVMQDVIPKLQKYTRR